MITNTYASNKHCLEADGLDDADIQKANSLACELARNAVADVPADTDTPRYVSVWRLQYSTVAHFIAARARQSLCGNADVG